MMRQADRLIASVCLLTILFANSFVAAPNSGMVSHIAGPSSIPVGGTPIVESVIPPVGQLGKNAGPLSIAQGNDGTFWVAEFSAGAIAQFFPSNDSFRQFIMPGSNHFPAYVTVDAKGKVWFSDQGGEGSIVMLDPSTGSFTAHPTPCQFSSPVGVALDADGNVWFAEDSCNNLGELVYPSYSPVEFQVPTLGSGPAEITIEPNATAGPIIWFTESLGNRIAMFQTSTHAFREFTPSVPFASPVGIVRDVAGKIWVSEHGGSSIVMLDPTTGQFTKFPTSPPSASSGYANSAPATLAVDPVGRLWFVEHFSNKVGRLDPSTGRIDEFAIPGSGVYSVLSAVDSSGNFWFAEFSTNRIGMVPGNATVPVQVSAQGTVSSPSTIPAGSTVQEPFTITNNGASPATFNLNVTTTFRADGYTTLTEASLSSYAMSLSPGESRTVVASITPDGVLSSGSYSVGVWAHDGNLSSVGVLSFQVTLSFFNEIVYVILPIALQAAVVALVFGNLLVYAEIRKTRKGRGGGPRSAGAFILVLLFSLLPLQALIPIAVAKCPGLPGLGTSSSGPNYISLIVSGVEAAATIVLAFYLIRGYRTLRHLK